VFYVHPHDISCLRIMNKLEDQETVMESKCKDLIESSRRRQYTTNNTENQFNEFTQIPKLHIRPVFRSLPEPTR